MDIDSLPDLHLAGDSIAEIFGSPGDCVLIHVSGNGLLRCLLDLCGSGEVRKTLGEIDRVIEHRLACHLANNGLGEVFDFVGEEVLRRNWFYGSLRGGSSRRGFSAFLRLGRHAWETSTDLGRDWGVLSLSCDPARARGLTAPVLATVPQSASAGPRPLLRLRESRSGRLTQPRATWHRRRGKSSRFPAPPSRWH